jgi:hypothetical protein
MRGKLQHSSLERFSRWDYTTGLVSQQPLKYYSVHNNILL